MRTNLDDLVERMSCGALVLVVAMMAIVPGVVGWFVGNSLGGHGEAGLLAGYGVLALLIALIDRASGPVTLRAFAAFLLGLPVVFVLVVLVKLLLQLLDLASFPARELWLTSLWGALVGSGLAVGTAWLGTMRKASARSPYEPRLDIDEVFHFMLSFRFPLALLIAAIFGLPDTAGARAVVGGFWGVLAGVGAVLYATLVDEKPVRAAWFHIIIAELLLVLGVVAVLVEGSGLTAALQLTGPASVACVVTYLVAWAGATMRPTRRSGPTP